MASDPPSGDDSDGLEAGPAPWQRQWYRVIFEHDTAAGRAFDIVLLVVILVSVLAVAMESVASLRIRWGMWFFTVEWIITIAFCIEFVARLMCVKRPWRYVFSFFGMVDIISLLPSFFAVFFTGAHTFATIRTLRLLRVFRILKLARHVTEAQGLLRALRQTWPKITVFLSVVFSAIIILGTAMYLVEADAGSGFDDIPTSIYWAIVTMTTVGYGDIAPATPLGKSIAALMMLLGYAIIIVPIGIFSAQTITEGRQRDRPSDMCGECGARGLPEDANYCHRCGQRVCD